MGYAQYFCSVIIIIIIQLLCNDYARYVYIYIELHGFVLLVVAQFFQK